MSWGAGTQWLSVLQNCKEAVPTPAPLLVLEFEFGALDILGKCSTAEVYFQPPFDLRQSLLQLSLASNS